MGQSSRTDSERLFRWVTPSTKLAFLVEFSVRVYHPWNHPVLSAGDPQNSSIALVGTRWRVGSRDGETFYGHTWEAQI